MTRLLVEALDICLWYVDNFRPTKQCSLTMNASLRYAFSCEWCATCHFDVVLPYAPPAAFLISRARL